MEVKIIGAWLIALIPGPLTFEGPGACIMMTFDLQGVLLSDVANNCRDRPSLYSETPVLETTSI